MSDLASIPAGSYLIDLATNAAPGNGTGAYVFAANLGHEVRAIEVCSSAATPLAIYNGPDAAKERLMYIPAAAAPSAGKLNRMTLTLSKGARLSIGSGTATAVSTGTVIINLWR